MFNWFQCRGCAALRDEVADLRAERNLLRGELLNVLKAPHATAAPSNRSQAERTKAEPVSMQRHGWNGVRSMFEKKFRRGEGQKTTHEDTLAKYWAEKNAKMEAAAGLVTEAAATGDAAAIEEALKNADSVA